MTPDGSAAARVLDRVAVLVGAGVPPPRAWELVGGRPVTGGPAWDDVRLVLDVAERSGAPTAGTLRGLASAMRRTSAADRAVRVALAGPRTSARVVLALPVFGVGLGAAWGAGAVEVLLTRPVGWTCLVVAAALVAVGRHWTGALVRRASPDGRIPGVLLDAWAVALAGGGSRSTAASTVAAVLAEHGRCEAGGPDGGGSRDTRVSLGTRRAGDRDAVAVARLHEALELGRRAGVPAAALLRAAAEDVRDDAAAAGLADAERLGVRLVLPLGVCVLPAFVLVGVVPVVVGVLSSTVGGLG